jgi:hypothetical protein
LPPSIHDWFPENHLARFIVDVAEVDSLLRQAEAAEREEIPDGMNIPEELSRREKTPSDY